MIFRVIAVIIALIIGIGAVVPALTVSTEAGVRNVKHRKKKLKKYKRYSKKWRRVQRARKLQRERLLARKRSLRLRRIRLELKQLAFLPSELKDTAKPFEVQNQSMFRLVEGKINKVIDGDTVSVQAQDGKSYIVRMLGIDAPSLGQRTGERSRKNLADFVLGKNATVIFRKRDSNDLYFGTVYAGGKDINRQQIESGMAIYFEQAGFEPMNSDIKLYKQAEQKARVSQKGLWIKQKSLKTLAIKEQ